MRRDLLSSSRKRRRKKFIFKAILFFLVFLAIMAAIASFFYIPFLKVKKISVEGNTLVATEQIAEAVKSRLAGKYLKILPRENIFLIPKKEILKNLPKEIPRVKTIQLSREFFDGISVKITERENAALLCAGENCAAVDGNGFVFEKTPYISGGIIIKFFDQRNFDGGESPEAAIGKNILPQVQFEKIMEFSKLIPKIGNEIVKIILKKEDIYEFYTKEGWHILINAKNEPGPTFANLMTALNFEIKDNRKKLDYVDLRFGNKVYYKFKSY